MRREVRDLIFNIMEKTATKAKQENKDVKKDSSGGNSSDGKRKNPRKTRKPRGRRGRPRSEFDQKIVDIRRVTRVVAGGRRFSFSVSMVVGDRKGRVGVGVGKATDTALAIEKAARDAQKNIISVKRDENNSIPHEVKAKFKASIVEIRPATGRGLVAGSSVRDVLDLAGLTDVSSKLYSRSKNKLNNARAAVSALQKIK